MIFNKELISKLDNAKKIVFFTGAGISAESGISTFRGKEGIWNKLRPEELANFDAFLKNPKLVWEWYQMRRDIVHKSNPNAGHIAIAEIQGYFEQVTVITQNVDNLHRRAGSNSVYELHGNIEKNYCIDCYARYDYVNFPDSDQSPRCDCGGLIRPDIVWFGEMLPQDQYTASEKAARECDILFAIGTSAVVYPAAYIPMIARENHKFLVEVNIENTEMSRIADAVLLGKSGDILPKLVELIKSRKQNG